MVVLKLAKRGTTKFESDKQEQQVAADFGGKVVIASGALWGSKGDVVTDLFLIECKTTESSTYRLDYKKTWNKIFKEATSRGLIPLMVISVSGDSYVVYQHCVFDTLYDQRVDGIKLKINGSVSTSSKSTAIPLVNVIPSYTIYFKEYMDTLTVCPYEVFLEYVRENHDVLKEIFGW